MKSNKKADLRYLALVFIAACALGTLVWPKYPRASAQSSSRKFNGLIAFVSNRNGPPGEIYLMNPDGSGQRNITNSSASETRPAFSPDGKKIAFVRDPGARSALIADLAAGRQTRAGALRTIVEDESFTRKEFGPAFVLTQYFGYLQRNPDEGRDTDMTGFNYWLGKLNQFNGDYVRAEMVKAFISSSEYRSRFCSQ